MVKLLGDLFQLGTVRFQELAPRRNIIKQVFHHYVSAIWTRCRLLSLNHRAGHLDESAQLVSIFAGAHLDGGNGNNRCHSLAAETNCLNVEQVGGLLDFRCGVPFEAHPRVGGRHSAAVVNNLDERLAGIFHNNLNLGGSGVNGILHKLFDNRCRALHNFAGGYLVGHMVR